METLFRVEESVLRPLKRDGGSRRATEKGKEIPLSPEKRRATVEGGKNPPWMNASPPGGGVWPEVSQRTRVFTGQNEEEVQPRVLGPVFKPSRGSSTKRSCEDYKKKLVSFEAKNFMCPEKEHPKKTPRMS